MAALLVRAGVSGIIVALVALIARRSPAAGALVASLPLVSVLGMIWLWHDTGDPVRLADHAQATLWYVLPSLPMFLVIRHLVQIAWVHTRVPKSLSMGDGRSISRADLLVPRIEYAVRECRALLDQ